MDRVHPSQQIGVASDILLAWRAVAAGVTPTTTRNREKYWRHWRQYAALCKCDPFLTTVPSLEREIIVSAFAARVRTGIYGHGHQVQVQTVTDALSAITKTIELAGQLSPIYKADGKYTTTLQRMIEGFRREDPPSIPQLAVPIMVPNLCYNAGIQSKCPFKQATGCLVIIAFFYLLRVGEYNPPRYVTRNGEKFGPLELSNSRLEMSDSLKKEQLSADVHH